MKNKTITIIFKDGARLNLNRESNFILFTDEHKKGIDIYLQIIGVKGSFKLATLKDKSIVENSLHLLNQYIRNTNVLSLDLNMVL